MRRRGCMETETPKTTKQIIGKYGISRQTIHNWLRQGLLPKPQKDFRNWYIWTKKDENNLKKIIEKKTAENNSPRPKEKQLLYIHNRRYLGSKQKLLNFIEEVVLSRTKGVSTVADIFAGTGVVAARFQDLGKKVIVNDILRSNYVAYKTWFSDEPVNYPRIVSIIEELNSIEATEENYVSKHFGDKYFSMENARKIGAIREKIDTYKVNKREKAFLLTSLMYAMDKVANTVGHYDAYRKKMDSLQPIKLQVPKLIETKGNEIFCEDANNLVKRINADLVYIDTPYNSRQYGDAYHLLENIIEWRKPKVEGVAKKMVNRQHIKSDYSTKKAPEVFDNLIQNIKAKYILVSYNNMAKKGNSRSNAKISNEEIIASLQKRGTVQIFDTPFQAYTTGRTNIDDHRELLYLCTIHEQKNKYIPSAINYTGGKYRLLPQIIPLFPDKIRDFYDVFSGGANVAINVKAKGNIIINDIELKVIELYRFIQKHSYKELLEKINVIIKKYGLSDTKSKGYDYYGANSSDGLKNVNKANYEKLRDDFNQGKFGEEESIAFYVLIVYAFNNQIRFNSKGYFNMPAGKRDFNKKMEFKLKEFKDAITKKNIQFRNEDFRIILNEIHNTNDFVYLDPPYLISNASYNENNGWNESDEKALLELLDELNRRNIRFALSNVLVHKGVENKLLKEWSKKYYVHYLNYNYNNSNYQSTAKFNETIEVLVTNY